MSDWMRNRNRLVKRKTPTFILWLGVIIGIGLFAVGFTEAITLSTIWRTKAAAEGTILHCGPKRILHDLIAPQELTVAYHLRDENNRIRRDARGQIMRYEITTLIGNWNCPTANQVRKTQVFYSADKPDVAMTADRYTVSMVLVFMGTFVALALVTVCGGRIYARAREDILSELDKPFEREEREAD